MEKQTCKKSCSQKGFPVNFFSSLSRVVESQAHNLSSSAGPGLEPHSAQDLSSSGSPSCTQVQLGDPPRDRGRDAVKEINFLDLVSVPNRSLSLRVQELQKKCCSDLFPFFLWVGSWTPKGPQKFRKSH